jgi:hypothetical protein
MLYNKSSYITEEPKNPVPGRLVRRWNEYYLRHKNEAKNDLGVENNFIRGKSSMGNESVDLNDVSKRKSRALSISLRENAALRSIEMVKTREKSPQKKKRSPKKSVTHMNVSAALNCTTDHERRHYIDVLRKLGEGRAEYCRAVKKQYRHLFEKGLLGRQAFRDINDAEEKMLDTLDEYFVVINHRISSLLHLDIDPANQQRVWVNFCEKSGENFHAMGELRSFSTSLVSLTNISRTMIWFSRINCVKQVFHRFFYDYIDRARDITCNYIHAHEAVVHHKEKLGIADEDILNHVICESVFQIMEAKKVLHNMDDVFPQVVHHLQTMTAARYLLHCEKENVKSYFQQGEIEEDEYDKLVTKLDLSARKLLTHAKPEDTTPDFKKLIQKHDVYSECLGRVHQHILANYGEPKVEKFLSDIASYGKMVYLRAGDLVYQQGQTNAGTFSSLGVYFLARGTTYGVIVPKEVKIQSRRMREQAYLKQISTLREQALEKMFTIERKENKKLKKQREQQKLHFHKTEVTNMEQIRSQTGSSLDRLLGENDVEDGFEEMPAVEQDAYLRSQILKQVKRLRDLLPNSNAGKQSTLRCNFFLIIICFDLCFYFI